MTVRAYAINAKTWVTTHELPFTSLQVNNVLSGIGSWSMELPLSFASPDGVEVFTADNFSTNRFLVAIVKDGTPIMMGLVESESAEINENTEVLRIGGPEASLGYLDRRVWIDARSDVSQDLFRTAEDVIFASDFLGLNEVIAVSYEPASGTAGINVQLGLDITDRKTLYDYMEDLVGLAPGFEFASYLTGDLATGFTTGIVLGYPQLYRRTGFVLELGKNIKRLRYDVDGKQYANVVYMGGAKKGQFVPMRAALNAGDLSTYPYYMKVETANDVVDEDVLLTYAQRLLAVSQVPPRRYELEVDTSDPEVQLGSWRVGDEFRLIANRGRVVVDSFFRVESWSLSVNADGDEAVTMRMFETGTF